MIKWIRKQIEVVRRHQTSAMHECDTHKLRGLEADERAFRSLMATVETYSAFKGWLKDVIEKNKETVEWAKKRGIHSYEIKQTNFGTALQKVQSKINEMEMQKWTQHT